MTERGRRPALFPALLRHWRHQRGMSQLDLSLAADVSARHVSFLETGRSAPSAEMVLRLATTLGVPLRHTNAMLRAAGHAPVYEDDEQGEIPPQAAEAVELLKRHHDPLPLLVVDRVFDVLDRNEGANALLDWMGLRPPSSPDRQDEVAPSAAPRPNLARLTFAPDGAQPHIANFDEVGRSLLWRLQREALEDPGDGPLEALLAELLSYPTVADDWRQVDLSVPAAPSLVVHLRSHGEELRFLTTVTVFQGPQNVQLDDLRIEQWFPYDETTDARCATWVGSTT